MTLLYSAFLPLWCAACVLSSCCPVVQKSKCVVLEKLFEVSDVQREQSENCRQRLALQPHVGAKMEVECNPVLHLGGWPVFICGCLDSSSYCDYRLDLGHLKCTTGFSCYCLGVSFNCLTGMHWCISLSANKMAFTAGIESALKFYKLHSHTAMTHVTWHVSLRSH